MITPAVVKNITWPKTYLLKDKEAYIVSTSEIEGANGLPRDTITLANKLQKVLHGVGKRRMGKQTKPNSAQRHAHRFIKWVNKVEGK